MREILFRGKGNKKYNGGGWYYGVPIQCDDDDWQICTSCSMRTVVTETIGQYTGLTDKNGKKIFEGDIVNYNGTNHKVVFETRGESAYFGIEINNIETWRFCLEIPAKLMNVIGNIYDNPELLRSDTE